MQPESDHERVRNILEQEFFEAVQRRDFVLFRFEEVTKDILAGCRIPPALRGSTTRQGSIQMRFRSFRAR